MSARMKRASQTYIIPQAILLLDHDPVPFSFTKRVSALEGKEEGNEEL